MSVELKNFFEHMDKITSLVRSNDEEHLKDARGLLEAFVANCKGSLFAPMSSVATSMLQRWEKQDSKEVLHALRSISLMLDNVEKGAAHLNERLQEDFFKRWFSSKPKPPRRNDEDPEVSSADFLEDGDDDIEKFFAMEAAENLDRIRYHIEGLRSDRQWRDAQKQLKAVVHTLKGSSGIIGDDLLSQLAHRFEESLTFIKQPKPVYIEAIRQVTDIIEWMTGSRSVGPDIRKEKASVAFGVLDDLTFARVRRKQTRESAEEDSGDVGGTTERSSSGNTTFDHVASLMEQSDSARSVLIDDVRQARSINENMRRSFEALKDAVKEIFPAKAGKSKHIHTVIRESFSDLEEYSRLLDQRLEDCGEGMERVQLYASEVWRELSRSRRIPIRRMFGILKKTVDELSLKQNVKVTLNLEGGDLLLEKKVFETLFDPLVQLVRNSISHGIESPEQRLQAGKSETGRIDISFYNEDENIIIRLEDDGKGMDFDSLTSRAHTIKQSAVDRVEEDLIFVSGLSTSSDISEVAGRGVGMDVVATSVSKLNGLVKVKSEPGKYSKFLIRIPASRLYARTYVVRANRFLFALPAALVREQEGDQFFDRDRYAVLSLSQMLGGSKGKRPRLLVGAVEKRFYLEVDEIVGERFSVLLKMGKFFKHLHPLWGATHMPEGEIAFVPDLRRIFSAAANMRGEQLKLDSIAEESESPTQELSANTVLVVDDSISVRESLKRTLLRHGFSVLTAENGEDALSLLQDTRVDLLITDLEMPGIDGYSLIRKLQTNGRETLPIVVVSSRDESREGLVSRGMQVSGFLRKPFQENRLLSVVKRVLT